MLFLLLEAKSCCFAILYSSICESKIATTQRNWITTSFAERNEQTCNGTIINAVSITHENEPKEEEENKTRWSGCYLMFSVLYTAFINNNA